MISHPLVDDYIKMAESGEIVVNKERKLLFKIIKEKNYPVMICILIMT
ncbi:putative phage terminase, large subunit [Streptococcus pneumoniae]|nr:putative phage terminase, large subunit [Streptococcus pneumoniae]